MHTQYMVDLTILSPDVQAVDPVAFPAIDSLAASTPQAEPASTVGDVACDRQDSVIWTPDLWWLLNWWTWLFPPPSLAGVPDADGGQGIYIVEQVQVDLQAKCPEAAGLGPVLSVVEEPETSESPPPRAREQVMRVINLGNGMIDLFA